MLITLMQSERLGYVPFREPFIIIATTQLSIPAQVQKMKKMRFELSTFSMQIFEQWNACRNSQNNR